MHAFIRRAADESVGMVFRKPPRLPRPTVKSLVAARLRWFAGLLLAVGLAYPTTAQEPAVQDPFAVEAPIGVEGRKVAEKPVTVHSGYRQQIKHFPELFPASKFDPLEFEKTIPALKPQSAYYFCFETGVLVRFDFFPAKASFFNVLLMPAQGSLKESRLSAITEDFVLAALLFHPKDLAKLVSSVGGMGTHPKLNISLTAEQLGAIQRRRE